MNTRVALLIALSALSLWFAWTWWRAEHGAERAPSAERRAPSMFEYGLGFIVLFLDTLGIGSFAPTTSVFKLRRMVADEHIPGTLNIGTSVPVVMEAFIFIAAVQVDPVLLVSTICAAVLGAWTGASLLVRMERRTLQRVIGSALLMGALMMVLTNLELMPSGGTALALSGWKFAVAVIVHFLLGALMTAGIGLFAPSIITLALLGMHPLMAFPIMMGACAFLQPVASKRFLASGKYALAPAIGLTAGGVAGVAVAAFIVKSLPMTGLRWLVVGVVMYAAVVMLRASMRR